MESDLLLLAVGLIVMFAAVLIWKLYDDFVHDTKGLTKLPSKRRVRH